VVINSSGQLGTKVSAAKQKRSGQALSAKVSSLSHEVRRQAREIRQLQAQVGGG